MASDAACRNVLKRGALLAPSRDYRTLLAREQDDSIAAARAHAARALCSLAAAAGDTTKDALWGDEGVRDALVYCALRDKPPHFARRTPRQNEAIADARASAVVALWYIALAPPTRARMNMPEGEAARSALALAAAEDAPDAARIPAERALVALAKTDDIFPRALKVQL